MGLYCDYTFEEADFLLKRDWAIDIEDIRELLHELPDDTYFKVIENIDQYPNRVRDLFPKKIETRIKVSDFTDKMMDEKIKKEEDDLDKWVKQHRSTFVAPPRPREYIDDWFDETVSKIEQKRTILNDMIKLSNKSKKYTPPGQRTIEQDEPMIRDTRKQLETLENELVQVSKRIETSNKTWTELKWIDAIIAEKRR